LPKPKTSCNIVMYWPIWEDNININFKERRCDNVEWIRLLQNMIQLGTFVKTVIPI
jgi:hypothetical protein